MDNEKLETPVVEENKDEGQHYDSGFFVSVRFLTSKKSFFFHHDSDELKIGDYVVVTAKVGVFLADDGTYDAILYNAHCEIKSEP